MLKTCLNQTSGEKLSSGQKEHEDMSRVDPYSLVAHTE